MYDIQIVIRFAKLTAFQEHLGNFFDGDMVIDPVQPFVVGAAGDGEIFVLLHSALDGVQIIAVQMAGGDEQIGLFTARGLLPEQLAVRVVGEALVEGHAGGQHVRVVIRVDDRFSEGVLVDEGGSQLVETVSAALFPFGGLGDPARVFPGDHLVKTHFAVGVGMTAHFNADVPAAHLVGNGGGRAGAEEGVENQVAGVGGNVNNTFN